MRAKDQEASSRPAVRVAGIVLKWVRADKEANFRRAEPLIRAAAAKGARIVCTTECFLDGYAIADKSIPLKEYRALGEPIPGGTYYRRLADLAGQLKIHLVAGMLEVDGEARYNTAVLIGPDGKLIGKYRKQKLGHESARNTAGSASPVFETPYGCVGIMICADRTEEKIVRCLCANGADFLICPSGGMFGPKSNDPIVQARSRENKVPIVFVHPAEFLVTGPDGSILDRTILGDALLVIREQVGTGRDQNRVFFFELPVRRKNKSSASGGERAEPGQVEITVLDQATGKPSPCRIHLKDATGKPQRGSGLPFWHDHFVCPGTARLELAPGRYTFEVDRGPEFRPSSGSFTLRARGSERLTVKLERLVDLSAEGWWSGELHVHRPLTDIELLMQAEDLHFAPVITWWNNRNLWAGQKLPASPLVRFGNRSYHVLAGEDEREGGALLYFNLSRPLAIAGASREYPSPLKFVEEARRHKGVWIDVEKPFWWDVPVWVASGQVDSIGLANNHMCRDRMYESEAWGKPRVVERLPPPLGNGYWSQEIYYHLLNCGLRLPPSAGSASGVLPNPVGYNRVYVQAGADFNEAKWWESLRAGRCFVTNGPLLRVEADGKPPGHVFTVPKDKGLALDVRVKLTSRDTIRFLEIIKNGQVERKVAVKEWARTGTLGTLRFRESGWFLVRAIADNPKTFRFASTGPYYVEVGESKRRISKASAQFFLDWVRERAGRIKLEDPTQREEVLRYHRMAEKFWQKLLAKANVK
ncbi:MAG: carbon-nitrogen hydrolase family protein [Planctomycetes bacterium]|nr:carbon-nitrogen hydrolase family protein [Planctomycetota bacterium]